MKDNSDRWVPLRDPNFKSSALEYYVGHEPPPPDKHTITLTVNGKEWVLPEPLREEPEKGAEYWIVNNAVNSGAMCLHWDGQIGERLALNHNTIHATSDDAQAWAEFDKWCRGGGA
ncbi:hypothetical protein FVQ98_10505 [Ottowia sp. GY511]|uniref:DUF2442 domain-containing protein n=1 Tax=Ottowia flava TaxID=2675430 RepID=A0ABW4KPC8_9BURK|nr:hypothetical protein FVQ98_10505 [Ottowia sp. GY511]